MEWEIKKRSEQCARCQKPFQEEVVMYSALFQQQDEFGLGIERKDWCADCWDECISRDGGGCLSGSGSEDESVSVEPLPEETVSAESESLSNEASEVSCAGTPWGVYWQGRFRIIEKKKAEDPIKYSQAEALFRKFLHSKEREHINLCYILALMLERKKKIVQRKTIDEAASKKKLIIYEQMSSGDTFVIQDPCLGLEEIPSVQRQVTELLN